jgi:hypothetical protein
VITQRGPDPSTVAEAIALASRAPSIHNTQPWRWQLAASSLQLHADPTRRLAVADPTGRSMLISCGATLHHLRVAMAARGWASEIIRLPSEDASGVPPTFLASLVFDPADPTADDLALAAAIPKRRTDRRSMSSWPVSDERIAKLVGVAAQQGAVLQPLLAPLDAAIWDRLARRVARHRRVDPAYLAEIQAWLRLGAEDADFSADDGIPVANLLSPHDDVWGVDPPDRFPDGRLPNALAEGEPPVSVPLLITTSSDDALSRLRAGEALSAVLLESARCGLATRLDSQPIEVGLTRTVLERQLLNSTRSPQLLVRVGWPASSEEVPATPRREVDEVLAVDGGW